MLNKVSFRKPVERAPRLSKPYVPGRHHERFWTKADDAVLRAHYETGGVAACQAHLPEHRRSASGIYQRALKLGLTDERGGVRYAEAVPEDFDERLRAAWAELDGRKKGEVAALADRFGVPRWWLGKRAMKLGLSVAHRKEPRWTTAEDELMQRVPLHQPDRAAAIFREHGFSRSPTAIVVRAKRLALSRRTHETLSAGRAAAILGVDAKWITAECISGVLPADRREDKRSPQQGGSAWAIEPADLRAFIVEHIERIDIRKVDKVAFVALLVGEGPGGVR